MERTYKAKIAVLECGLSGWKVTGEEKLTVYLDDDSGDGHTEGEIWEAVYDQFYLQLQVRDSFNFCLLEWEETTVYDNEE